MYRMARSLEHSQRDIENLLAVKLNSAAPLLLTARCLPDELICGYRGRLCALNRIGTETEFMAALRSQVHPEDVTEFPSALTLARAAGQDLRAFVRDHTMLALHRAVTPHDPDISHGDPGRLEIIDYFGARLFNLSLIHI